MRLKERLPKKLYYFISKNGRRMTKFSGDKITVEEVRMFEIPSFLVETEEIKKIKTSPRKMWNQKNLPK